MGNDFMTIKIVEGPDFFFKCYYVRNFSIFATQQSFF